MARMFVDCRDYPSEMNCTVAISADTKEELVDAAVQHAVAVLVTTIAHNCARSWPR
jgi:predicted small metal-binding protein